MRLLDFAQIAVIVGVAELAENPGARRTPVAAEVVNHRIKELKVGVKMVVVEISEVERAAVGFARPAVVAHQDAADLAAKDVVQLGHKSGIHRLVQFAAEAVNDERRVMVNGGKDVGVFQRGLPA